METTSTLLSWIIFSPLLFGLLIIAAPNALEKHFRTIALVQTIFNALLATVLYWKFDGLSATYQMTHFIPWLPEWGVNYMVGVDGLSLPLVMLTAYFGPVAILGTWPHGELKKEKFFV